MALMKQKLWVDRLTLLVVTGCLAMAIASYAPAWYVHDLTSRYEQANGPLWTAQVQRAWHNVLDPLWEANHGAILRLGEMLGLGSTAALHLPMKVRRLSAAVTGETVDTSDGISSSSNIIPFVYGAPSSMLDRMRERDPYLRSHAGQRLLSTMAGFRNRQSVDNTYYEAAPRTPQSQAMNNPYAPDGFRTYSFFALVRYAIMRYEFGDQQARLWYENQLCADDGADWDYSQQRAEAALQEAGHKPPACQGQGLHAHIKGFRALPTFADMVAKDPQLPGQLWGRAAKRFGIDVFMAVLVLMLVLATPGMWLVRGIANGGLRQ